MEEKGGRGFAAMDPEKQRRISSKGGTHAHEKGTAHEFSPDEAREAGRKGGVAAQEKGTAHRLTAEERRLGGKRGGQKVSVDRRHMAEIGRKGGLRSRGARRAGAAGEESATATARVAEARPAAREVAAAPEGGPGDPAARALARAHREVLDLVDGCEQAARGGGDGAARAVQRLAARVRRDVRVSEEVVGSEVERAVVPEGREWVAESRRHREAAIRILDDVVSLDPRGDTFRARLRDLRGALERWFQHDDERLIPAINERMPGDSSRLADRIESRRRELDRGAP